jgi:hypothetical protein
MYDVEGNLCDLRTAEVTKSQKLWSKLIGAWAPINMAIIYGVKKEDKDFDMTVKCIANGTSKLYDIVSTIMLRFGLEVMQKRLIAILRRWLDKDTAGMIVAMATQ